jgi:hypothetical protein
MPRRIVLHAGFHKTGTSSVQQTLRANRAVLKPALAMRLKGQMGDLMHATRGYSTWRDPLTLAKATRRFGALLDDLPNMPRRCLVISAEELSGHMPGRGDLMDYNAAPILMRKFSKAITARYPKAAQVIYFSTRAPDSWLNSAYWEHVKSSSMTLDFDEFATSYAKATDFDQIVAQTRKAVGCEVHHTRLEDCTELRLGPTDPLLDLCDIPDDIRAQIIAQPMANTRHSDAVLLALLAANRAYDDRDARKAAKHAILAKGAQT